MTGNIDVQEREAGTALRSAGAKALQRYLQDEIAGGRLRAGVKLPPERELSQRFGASRGSVRPPTTLRRG